jgi:hypothetical protein
MDRARQRTRVASLSELLGHQKREGKGFGGFKTPGQANPGRCPELVTILLSASPWLAHRPTICEGKSADVGSKYRCRSRDCESKFGARE